MNKVEELINNHKNTYGIAIKTNGYWILDKNGNISKFVDNDFRNDIHEYIYNILGMKEYSGFKCIDDPKFRIVATENPKEIYVHYFNIEVENTNEFINKLSILKYTYGMMNQPIITLNYHGGKENLNFYPKENKIDIDIFDKIFEAFKEGYNIEFDDEPTFGDLK